MEDYKPNSHLAKEGAKPADVEPQKRKVEQVTAKPAARKKKSGLTKFAEDFFQEDSRTIWDHVRDDILYPAAKKTVYDAFTGFLDMLLYGESRGGSRSRGVPGSRVSYRSYYDEPRETRRPARVSSYDYDDVVLDTRVEAEEVLNSLEDAIDRYGMISVNDLYDAVGIIGNSTDCKYGWKDIRSASVERVRDGYLIKMPRPLPID